MTMTILPSMLGHGHSFFNLIMTSSAFHFIARISFCTYLVHLMVLYNFTLSRNYNVYYNIIDNFIAYLGILVLSLVFGFITTVLIELPFAKLQKELMTTIKAKARKAKEAKEMH
jgi:peptidoglycan/LPS O-acetylase OafA/YrhL